MMAGRPTLNPFKLAVLLLALASTASAGPATKTRRAFIIFGDSLSDNGNYFNSKTLGNGSVPVPFAVLNKTKKIAYWTGRFTNAPGNWNDRLVTQLNRSIVANFAYGGATLCNDFADIVGLTPSVEKQISMYFARKQRDIKLKKILANTTTIPVIWAGGMDVSYILSSRISQLTEYIARVPQCLANVTRLLLDGGEQTVVLGSLGPLEITPGVVAQGAGPLLTPLTAAINNGMKQVVSQLRLRYPKKTILYWDLYKDFGADIISYKALGFKYGNLDNCLQATAAVTPLDKVPPKFVCAKPDEYMFFDVIHPSSKGHQGITSSFFRLLLNSSIISSSDIIPNPWFPKCTACLTSPR